MKGGFILVNKNDDKSSNNLDNLIKRELGFAKVGHLGTLDPLAKGLMILMVDDATKCAKYFDDLSKVYEVKIRLGATSDSLDYETPLKDIMDIDLRGREIEIDDYLESFKGVSMQEPPLYSAIKENGKKYYEIVKNNPDYTPKDREVTMYSIERITPIEYIDSNSFFTIRCHVSKGYYVRSLARDIGKTLGISSMAASINRIKVGPFSLNNAYTKEEILNNKYEMINPLSYINIPSITVDKYTEKKVLNGIGLDMSLFKGEPLYKIYSGKELIAIYKRSIEKSQYVMDLLIKR